MREYKPNQPKIFCRGGCRVLNYTRWRERHGWWRLESRVPNADWEALYGPVLRGLAWEYQGKVQSCFVINSYRFFSVFLRKGFKDFGAPPSNLPSNCFDVSTISRKNMENTWQENNTNTENPSVEPEPPSFVLSDTPNNCFKTQPEACHHIVGGFVPTGRVEDVEIPAPLRPHG
jgi:hypothetical protein